MTETTARRRFISPAEQALTNAKHRDRIVAVLAYQYKQRTGWSLSDTMRRALKDNGETCAAVRPWDEVHTDYRGERESGARTVLVCGGLVSWLGPEAWAEAEKEASRPRTRQAWLTYGLRVRRGATATPGTDASGKRVDLYPLGATETGEPLGQW